MTTTITPASVEVLSWKTSPAARTWRHARTRCAWWTPCNASGASRTRRRARVKRMVERGVVLASAFPGLYIELQGPADARRRVHPALLRISRAILLPQANMERNLVLQIQDLKFLRPDFGQIFPTSQILTTLTKRAVI